MKRFLTDTKTTINQPFDDKGLIHSCFFKMELYDVYSLEIEVLIQSTDLKIDCRGLKFFHISK